MRAATALCAAGAFVLLAAPAAAETGAEVRGLAAAAAAGDAVASDRLLGIRDVDGRPVDFARALRGAEGARRAARLRVIAADAGAAPAASMDDPRGAAEAILDDSRYRGSEVPRPLHRPLAWLGDRLRDLVGPVERVVERIPGGLLVWPALAVVLGAGVLALLAARRRAGGMAAGAERHRVETLDPARLEAEAEQAERSGDPERALRLLFRAGLARLALVRAIPPGEWTSGELRPIVADPAFDHLAADLDAVAYGRRSVRREDLEAARHAWSRVLDRARAQ
jgi:hypothetical protein